MRSCGGKKRIIDLDLKAYFDSVQHSVLLSKVARRVQDPDVLRLLKLILKSTGKQGVPQGGVISPVLSNLYLNEVDRMLEKAGERSAANPHAPFDVAGIGDQFTARLVRHSQRKRGATDRPDLRNRGANPRPYLNPMPKAWNAFALHGYRAVTSENSPRRGSAATSTTASRSREPTPQLKEKPSSSAVWGGR